MVANGERQTQLLRGALDMCLLALLAEAPTHAYDLVVRLEERGVPGVSYGTIYPLVARLRRLSLLHENVEPSTSGPPRKVFHLSSQGREALSDWVEQWINTTSAVQELLRQAGAMPERTKEPL